MAAFRPKDLLEKAQAAEQEGDKRMASAQYVILSSYLQKKGKWKEAKVLMDRAIRLAPRSARLYVQRALCEMKLGRESEARAAIDLFAHYATEKKRTEDYAPYMEEHLSEYLELKRAYYEGILKLDRTRAFPFLGLAKYFVKKGETAEAKKILLDGLNTNDRREELIENLAVVIAADPSASDQLQRFSVGEISLEELALLLDTKPVEAKQEKAPEPEFLVEEGPPDLRALIENLEEELGVDLKTRHDEVAPLVKEFRGRTEKILRDDHQGRLDLALAFFEMELFKDAREEVEKIPHGNSHYYDGQCLLGEIMCAEGSWLAALTIYQECLRNEELEASKKHHCVYKLIEIYMRLGDWKKAEQQIRILEKSDSNYRNLRSFKKEISAKERFRKAS
jgi:tetratricopeptide (TPR) repeat protein